MANIFSVNDPQAAFNEGFQGAQNFRDVYRANAAFNALENAYGPTVGDPKLAAAAMANNQTQQMDPLLLQDQQTKNALAGQTLQQQQIATQNDQAGQTMGRVHTALTGALQGLGASLQGVDDPTQRGTAFDQAVTQVAPMLGVDPAQLAGQLKPYRDQVVANGADALPQIQQELDGVLNANLTPAQRAQYQIQQEKLDIAKQNLDTAKARTAAVVAKGTAGSPAAAAKAAAQQNADQNTFLDYNTTVDNIAGPGGNIDQAIQYIRDHPDSVGFLAAGFDGHGAKDVGGTPANQLAQILTPITSNVMLNKLADLKKQSATGASGLGRLSNFEAGMLSGSLGSVNQGQSADQLIRNLQAIQKQMQAARDMHRQSYLRQYGKDPTDQSGAAAPAATGTTPTAAAPGASAGATAAPAATTQQPAQQQQQPQFTEGQTATGPSGKKIIFKGGQWQDQ